MNSIDSWFEADNICYGKHIILAGSCNIQNRRVPNTGGCQCVHIYTVHALQTCLVTEKPTLACQKAVAFRNPPWWCPSFWRWASNRHIKITVHTHTTATHTHNHDIRCHPLCFQQMDPWIPPSAPGAFPRWKMPRNDWNLRSEPVDLLVFLAIQIRRHYSNHPKKQTSQIGMNMIIQKIYNMSGGSHHHIQSIITLNPLVLILI